MRDIQESLVPDDHVIVVFGANGDLARRELFPALFHLDQEGLMPCRYLIIGNSRSDLSDAQFRQFAWNAVDEFSRRRPTEATWVEFSSKLSYVPRDIHPGDTTALEEAVTRAEAQIGGDSSRLFYLAVPPPAFATITRGLGACGLTERARVVYEKPFGIDLQSFRDLNEVVMEALDEPQVYRIDHFLGKETVQNILALRFANGMFEPVWNRVHIDHVQIDVPEEIGIGTRAGFYEETGALKDMLVTHLFQVLSFIAMEPPASFSPQALIDEKVKVFEAMVPLKPDDVVRGQYEGYRRADGVAEDSDTETFVAARLFIDNERWAEVPFLLRTGKRLAESRSVVTLAFRIPSQQMFADTVAEGFQPNHLTLELGPKERVLAGFLAKVPGPRMELGRATMEFRYGGSFGSELIEAYERLIHDALMGDRTLFTRPDGIERTWELVAEVLSDPPPLHIYSQGSYGPAAADGLLASRSWLLPRGTAGKE